MFLQVGTGRRDSHRPFKRELGPPARRISPGRGSAGQPGQAPPGLRREAPRARARRCLASGRPPRGAARSIPGMETGSDSGQRPARPFCVAAAAGCYGAAGRLGRAARAGRRVLGPRGERSRGGRRQVGRTSRERARAGARGARRGGRWEDGSALSKYKTGVSWASAARSRRAAAPGRAHRDSADRRRRLCRGARCWERPSRELAGDRESDACSEEDAGGGGDGSGRASWAQRGPRRATGGGSRPLPHRERRAPRAARPRPPAPAPPSLPGATWLRPPPPPPRTS